MKTFLIILFIISLSISPALAQRDLTKHPRIHALKMTYLTDRLRLTTSQATSFVPLYDEFEMEIVNSRNFYFRRYAGSELKNADDSTSRRFVDDNLDYQQTVIEIKRRYNEQFLKIISSQQLAELYKAEREFKQILIKKYEKDRGGPRRGGPRR